MIYRTINSGKAYFTHNEFYFYILFRFDNTLFGIYLYKKITEKYIKQTKL